MIKYRFMSTRVWTFAVLAGPLLALACSGGEAPSQKLPDVRLPTYAAQQAASLASCSMAKCLTVYVAPWCGSCRAATPMLLKLRRYLQDRGVETRFVVGKDEAPALRAYAEIFGPDTQLDIDDSLSVGGVPHFFVSDSSGGIVKEVSGIPMGDFSSADMAAYFGLP